MAAPKLRFKEFDGTWKESRLKDLAVKITDGTHDTPVVQKEGIPFLTAINVKDGLINYDDIGYVDEITHKKIYERCNPEKDDLLIVNIGAGTATCARNIVDYQFSLKNVALVKPNRNLLNPIFLEQIQRKNSSKLFASLTSGGAQPFLSLKEIGKLLIKYPSLEEQTKIASFLSAVDEKISQLTQKHELLSQYKQGMMQKLFSQQIRFKADDGSEFGEWEEVKFSDIFNFHQTNSYSRALLAEYGEIMNIHYGDIHTKFSMLFDVNKESVPFLNDEVDTSKIAKEQFLKVGDLVIADASEDYKDIGKSIEVISLNNQKVVAGLHTYIARPVKPFALGFCGYMMQTFPVREQIKKLATGISVLGISKSNLGKVELSIPCLEEQTKIAKFLSSIDQKIEVVAQQIELAKQWKKGLLQQMFV
ncbi:MULTISPECIES: restriction endonuclease subunit S [unclassified Acinetobacter]|uniref:restriction endonuclease subunit S n=1 Tax=unclassified Acinetobacter TaxID=196816 RepID=UPI0015D19518|nr:MULTISPECIES: restriction endonuclease subunit S [unclassified Acinetobacter]